MHGIAAFLVACNTLFAPEAPEDVLKLLAATQQRTLQDLDRLSYDSRAETRGWMVEVGRSVVIETTVSVRKQSGTQLVTWAQTGDDSSLDVVESAVWKFLQTPGHFIKWQGVSKPEVLVYALADWREAGRDPVAEFGQMMASADNLARGCLGMHTPFFEIYGMAGEWKVLEFDPGGTMRISRDSPRTDGSLKTDLYLTLHSQTGLLAEASYLSDTPNAQTQSFKYVPHDAVPQVPESHSATNHSRGVPEPRHLEQTFSNFQDRSAEPPLTLKDLGLPLQGIIMLNRPDGEVQRQAWDGQELEQMKWEF